ncbi:hypothetical protein GCM10009863_66980 [Streptomyces axinellae]|uniref:Uncharacterized protein n=1 Tax=Streptomyces axinellae TaxID=552788 RepID=A0ABN3R0N4_9ACTN
MIQGDCLPPGGSQGPLTRAMMCGPTPYRPFEPARESPRQQVNRGAEGASSSLESLRPRYRASEADLKSGPPYDARRRGAVAPPKVQARLQSFGSCRRTSQVPMTDGEDIRVTPSFGSLND